MEQRVIQVLTQWLNSYRVEWGNDVPQDEQLQIEIKRKAIVKNQKELETLSKQLARTHDLLEQGVYDTDMFLERSRVINERMVAAKQEISDLTEKLAEDEQRAANRVNIIPKVEHLLSVYSELPDAQSKNDLLKDIVGRIEYTKDEPSPRRGPFDNFELIIYPNIPPQGEK